MIQVKFTLSIVLLLSASLFTGCYLDHSAAGGEADLAPALGVAPSEFVMLRDAYFKLAGKSHMEVSRLG